MADVYRVTPERLPMSKVQEKRAAIYGAGIAGLTVAHELVQRGWQVDIYETEHDAGGFFRSARCRGDRNMPSEYSWHGFGPWYHNAFAVMRDIRADASGSVYERALSRPIDFGVAPDVGQAQFDDTGRVMPDVRRMFRMTRRDALGWGWVMLKTWTANRRSCEVYAAESASQAWRRVLSPTAWRTWVACFWPWIGSDWKKVSLHTAGLFFRRQLITRPRHYHAADAQGPAWSQGARSGWLLLRAPSSEAWFAPWVRDLQARGVAFHFEQTLHAFEGDSAGIRAAFLADGTRVTADVHVLAVNPFAAHDILARTPVLQALDELRLHAPLICDGPHTQVSFRIAFAERIRWPRPRCALVIADSEFDLTIFAEEQVWTREVSLGENVCSLWTGTACVSSVPGPVHGAPVERCTEDQFIDEVKAQLLRCQSLDGLVREANGGRPLASFAVERIEVWHEWTFSPDGIRPKQPKWVTTTHTQPFLPAQRTPVPNLVLAGAHTRTDADVWSVEAAVESGRRAVQVFEPDVEVLPQYRPWLLRAIAAVDDALYAMGAPHVLVCAALAVMLFIVMVVAVR
jgi:hypothetical protein